jgi:hypothetical protein
LYQAITLFEPSEGDIRLGKCYPYQQIAVACLTGITTLIVRPAALA